MEFSMKKTEFLDTLRNVRYTWEALLAKVEKEEMTETSLPGGWSVKDVIAHITWHEREMAGMFEAKALVRSEWWELPMDERNALIYKEFKDQPLDEVLEASIQDYERFLKALEALPENYLNDPAQFKNMPGDWIPWQVIAGNSYEHYRQHIPEIEDWLGT